MKKEWLELVVCVVLYKYKDKKEEFSDYEFLLIKRNDCKWAIPGGIGASEITDNLFNFAVFEVNYDTNFHISIPQLEQFKTIISDCGKKITVFFSYNIGKYTTIHEDELRGELFTLKQIIGMEKSDKIAFNNAEIIKEFILCRR